MMYSVFEAAVVRQRRRRVTPAELPGRTYGEVVPHWWLALPLTTPPPTCVYGYSSAWPLLDVAMHGVREIYSLRLVALLEQAGVRFETFPVQLIDVETEALLSDAHVAFHLLERHQLTRTGADFFADRLPFEPPSLFCRDESHPHHTYIHADLRRRLEEAGITGCIYRPSPHMLRY